MSPFSPNRDLKINVTETPAGLHLLSQGMQAFGYAELEMVEVEKRDMREAGGVLNTLAGYIVNEARKVEPGQRIAVVAKAGALVARLTEGTAAEPSGFFGRLMGRPTRVLRVIEPVDGMAHGRTLFSTIRLWRAEKMLEAGDTASALAELRRSIAAFAGDPKRRGELRMGFPYNWENHLSYAMLADSEPALQAKAEWLEKALARSEELELARIGDTPAQIRSVGKDALLARTRVLARENAQPAAANLPPMEGMRLVPSPIRVRAERGKEIVAERSLVLVPALMAEYQPPGVGTGEPFCQAVTDVLWASVDRPAHLAALTDDVRCLYEGDRDEAPKIEGSAKYEIGDRLLTLLLADARRAEYAGVTPDEYRARGGAIQDPTLALAATARLDDLIARESEAYVQAIGGDLDLGAIRRN